jgi:hypothetical protein
MKKTALVPIVMLATTALLAGCGSTSTGKSRPSEPTVDQPGKTISRYRDPLVEVIVDYKFANLSQGSDWMILNVAVTSSESKAIEAPERCSARCAGFRPDRFHSGRPPDL